MPHRVTPVPHVDGAGEFPLRMMAHAPRKGGKKQKTGRSKSYSFYMYKVQKLKHR